MMKLTKEEEINFLINSIKADAKHFATAHYPELKELFAEQMAQSQYKLVQLGYTWEQVEEIEVQAYQAV